MDRPLRKGWTTGACSAAAARAAWSALHGLGFPDPVEIVLPRNVTARFSLAHTARGTDWAEATVIKDAGDDPDVTHGASITARVERRPAGSGLAFAAGVGIGMVTLPGLPLAVGEPAINPGPRTQIAANMVAVASPVDALVTISIPNGAGLAAKTMNARLGIIGGLSILGTTGVVLPYSCSAWVHSIQRGVDVAAALGLPHIAGSTGRTSEEAIQRIHGLPEPALIEMGDLAGALLKYLRRKPVARLTIAGGFAKLAKLAEGRLDLHSREGGVELAGLGAMLGELGASADIVAQAAQANSASQVLALAGSLPLADLVARRARESALAVLAGRTELDVAVFDRQGRLIGHAG